MAAMVTNTECLVTMVTFITKVTNILGVTFANMVIKFTAVHSLLWCMNSLISTPEYHGNIC